MKHGESQLQRSCVKWFDLQHPKLRQLLFAIPNGGARGKVEAGILKAEGVRAGVADLFLSVPKKEVVQVTPAHPLCVEKIVCPGLYIEMKFGKGKQTDSQKEFQKSVAERGYRYEVVSDFDSFKNLIETYLR